MISYISIIYVAGYTIVYVYKYWDIINSIHSTYVFANNIYKGVKYLRPSIRGCKKDIEMEGVWDDWELCEKLVKVL